MLFRSEFDAFGTAHSSTSISAALGMAVAAHLQGSERRSVAIIGDGATETPLRMTGEANPQFYDGIFMPPLPGLPNLGMVVGFTDAEDDALHIDG